MAFWINLYNVLILDAVIHFQLEGRVPFSLFQKAAYNVCGHRFSADDIEHGVLRANRPHPIYRLRPFSASDPRATAIVDGFDHRIHFALNCAASSCPPIAFYHGEHLEQQLELATANFIQGQGAQLNPEAKRLTLSKIFKWYLADFGGDSGVRKLVSEHLPAEEAAIIRSNQVRIKYADYDWTVNKILR
jgi:hypothetical protein